MIDPSKLTSVQKDIYYGDECPECGAHGLEMREDSDTGEVTVLCTACGSLFAQDGATV